MNHQEIEIKFFIQDLPALLEKIHKLDAWLHQARVFEVNLRFDTPERILTRQHQVLRLRRDTINHLTYKSPARPDSEVSARREIEFTVGDFDDARLFLEALGYEVSISYEKYRAVYQLDDALLMVDEMPFGNFLEIEGQDVSAIKTAAARLGLEWNARCIDSYMALFSCMQEKLSLQIDNLTFSELNGIRVSPNDLGLTPADITQHK
jgi:adenylate cyclase, class 2